MKKKIAICMILLYCLLCGGIGHAFAFSNKKAILLLSRNSQPDSIGFNFVKDMTSDVYTWISDGKITLWDSPEKKTTLNINDLKGIEKNSDARFTDCLNLFIYEDWTSKNRKFSFNVKGFSFTGHGNKGDVLFGFIEWKSDLRDLMKNTLMHCNANGNYNETLFSAVMNMDFVYTLVYFDNTPLQDYKNSERIVHKATNPKKTRVNRVRIPESKLIEYGWDSTDLDQSRLSDRFSGIFSNFFNTNQQEFYNYGGDRYFSYLKNKDLLITSLHVVQLWTRDKDGNITYQLVSVIPYTFGYALLPVPVQKLDEWNLKYKGKALSEILNERNFSYSIKKINETRIPFVMADWVKANLSSGNWNHILSNRIHLN